jgi:peptide/nickel transport system substrate-binding protein
MKLSRRRRWAAIVTVVALVVLGGCGRGSAGGDQTSGGKAKDTFVVALSSEPPHLMRLFLGDVSVGLVGLAMEESLVTVDRNHTIEPQLAESWEMLDDVTYRFHLRKNVTWHDGKPFTSADVVYTFENGLGINSGTAALQKLVKSAKAVDDNTVDITLNGPSGAFLAMLNPMSFSILPAHVYQGTDLESNPANRAPVGTGPFKFSSWQYNQITLVRNDDYWGDKPGFAKVVFTTLADPTARALALRNGDIDYINSYDVTYESLLQLKQDKNIKVDSGRSSLSMKMFPFNTRNPILAKPEVRKALFQAIDRDFISKTVFGGLFPAGHAALPDGHWANSGDVDYGKLFPYDPKAAESALDAAGYPRKANGIRFTLTHRYDASEPGGEKVAEVIADYWKAIGVETKIMQDDAQVFRDAVFAKHQFDTYTINIASGADPAIGLYRRYTCDNNQNAVFGNATGYCNSKLDEVFAAANSANEQKDRTPLYTQAQKMIADDLPTAILVQVKYTDAIRADLTGIDGFFRLGEVVLLDWSKIGPPKA